MTESIVIGHVLGKRYRIDKQLGRGGMGEVYAATHLGTGARVAVKVLADRATADDEQCHRLVREARAASAVEHPNVIRIFDVFEDEESASPVVLMELLEGETLADCERRLGRLSLDHAAGIFVQVARGLCAAHDVGIVHRDLKPANIFLVKGATLSVKVLDFGIAKILKPLGSTVNTGGPSTRTGVVMGTYPYMSYEQLMGEKVDSRTDIWSFGVTLLEGLTGRRPFAYESYAQLVTAFATEEIPRARRLEPSLPRDVCELLDACLKRDPKHRLGDMRAAITLLQRYVGWVQPSTRRPTRRRLLAGGTAAGSMLLALAWNAWNPGATSPTLAGGPIALVDAGINGKSGADGALEALAEGRSEGEPSEGTEHSPAILGAAIEPIRPDAGSPKAERDQNRAPRAEKRRKLSVALPQAAAPPATAMPEPPAAAPPATTARVKVEGNPIRVYPTAAAARAAQR